MSESELDILQRIENLLKLQVRVLLAPILVEQLRNQEYRKLYQLTGQASVTKIARKIGFSTGKISGIWKSWEDLGLIYRSGKGYRKSAE